MIDPFDIIGNADSSTGNVIAGTATDYTSLPTPVSSYTGQLWFVENGSGGLLSVLGAYKYPKGFYSPNASDVWEHVPLNVKVAEDSTTLVNITNWAEFFSYAFDISVGDRLIYNGKTYKNITGAMTGTAPNTDSTNWEPCSPLNSISVAKQGGDFTTIEDALNSITDSSTTNRYCIRIAPGVYTVDNSAGPVALKPFVGMSACTLRSVVFQPSTPANDMFTGASFAYVEGIVFSGNTTGVILNHAVPGTVSIDDCVLRDAGAGFLLNGATSSLEVRRLAVNNPAATTTTYAIKVTSGFITIKDLISRSASKVTTLLDISGVGVRGSIIDVTTESSDVVTAVKIYDGPTITGSLLTLISPYDGLVIYGDNTDVRFDSSKILFAQNDGFRIDNTGTGILFTLFATAITDSTRYNFNILNPNSTVIGNGFTEVDSSNVVPGAELYVYLLDLKEADEALKVFGEFHVGSPGRPAESAYGGGDSYTTGMMVYTETPGNVFTNVSEEAASPSGSTFTFPGTAVDNAIYVASSLIDVAGTDFLLHHGLKVSIETAGVLGSGSLIAEYWNGTAWVELNGMVADSSEPFLPYAKDYFSRLGGFQLRYDIVRMNDGTWMKNDPMALGTDYYWVRFRITAPITTAPVFQQFKLHPPRSEFNADGFLEYFGDARPYAQLPISVGSGKPFEGNMQSQSIWMDGDIGVGYTTNRFTVTGDKYGWEIISPNNIDTSSELAFRWCGRPTNTETMEWTVRWSWLAPDGTIYTSDPGPGTNPNSKSVTVSKAVTAGQLEWFQAYLDISDLIARRDTDYPDLLMVSIQPTTMGGNFALIGVQAYYLIWSGGGHAD